jgi:DNA-binding MarR family transcriptional regulator
MMHTNTIDTLLALRDSKVGGSTAERLALLLIVEVDEPMHMSEVARRLGLSRAALTTMIDRLVAQKLVKREHEHGGDRRRVGIVATSRARQVVGRAERAVVI